MQCNLKSPNSHFLQHLSWGSLSTIHYILLGRNETIVKTGAWNLSTSDNPTQHKVANHQQLLFFEQVRIVKFNQGTITKPRGSSSELQKLTLSTLKISSQSSSLSQATTTNQAVKRSTRLIMQLAPSPMGSLQHQPPLGRSRNRGANH